ncbi:MAG: hypothetical protein AAGG51_04475 [Cyanobacteria bacterium P01_G01_bin.54]
MKFNPEDYRPKPTSWFKTKIVYEGEGLAKFEGLISILKGYVKVTFYENGKYHAEMEVDSIDNVVLSASGMNTITEISSKNTKCTNLEVQTKDGSFKVRSSIDYSGFINKVKFIFVNSVFDANISINEINEKYWVAPLSNFLSDAFEYSESLGDHPLRVYEKTEIPEDLTEEERAVARLVASSGLSFILFNHKGSTVSIERLADYKEREEFLKKRQKNILVTSIMVGILNDLKSEIRLEDLGAELIPLLSFATGSLVGYPWLECYDEKGGLTRRLHKSVNRQDYQKGHQPFECNRLSPSLGEFLNVALSADVIKRRYISQVMSYVVLAGLNEFRIDEALKNIFLAFEILCKNNNIGNVDMKTELKLEYFEEIQEIITFAQEEIKDISKKANENEQKQKILEISSRLGSLWKKSDKNGWAIASLSQKFKLNDVEVMDIHYTSNPRSDGKSWRGLLSYCRGMVMHETGYFPEMLVVREHLYDLLVRITLKILNYRWKYIPIIHKNEYKERDLDWVTPKTSIQLLGYD